MKYYIRSRCWISNSERVPSDCPGSGECKMCELRCAIVDAWKETVSANFSETYDPSKDELLQVYLNDQEETIGFYCRICDKHCMKEYFFQSYYINCSHDQMLTK